MAFVRENIRKRSEGIPDRPPTPTEELKHLQLALEESKRTYQQEQVKRRSLQSPLPAESIKRSSSSGAIFSPANSRHSLAPISKNGDSNLLLDMEKSLIEFHDPIDKRRQEKVDEIKDFMRTVSLKSEAQPYSSSHPQMAVVPPVAPPVVPNQLLYPPQFSRSGNVSPVGNHHQSIHRNTSNPAFGWQPFVEPSSTLGMANNFMRTLPPIMQSRPHIGFEPPPAPSLPYPTPPAPPLPYPTVPRMPQPEDVRNILNVHTEEVGVKWRRPSETTVPVNAFLQIPFRQSVWQSNGDLIDFGPWGRLDNKENDDHRVTVWAPEDLFREFDPLAIKYQKQPVPAVVEPPTLSHEVVQKEEIPLRPPPLSVVNKHAAELEEIKKRERCLYDPGFRDSFIVSSDMLRLKDRKSELQTQVSHGAVQQLRNQLGIIYVAWL